MVKMAEVARWYKPLRKPPNQTPQTQTQKVKVQQKAMLTTRGAKVSKQDEAKSDDFNKRYKDKLGYGVNVGMLKAVFQRGLGAFNVSHRKKVLLSGLLLVSMRFCI